MTQAGGGGSFFVGPGFPGCPSCRADNVVRCGRCEQLGCWDQSWPEFTCPTCGNSGPVEGIITEISALGGGRRMSAFWEVQRLGFQLAGGAIRASGKAVTGAARAGRYTAGKVRDGHDRSRGGVLGPGDGPAPPAADVLDYRGLAPTTGISLVDSGLPLGNLLDVRRGPIARVALPLRTILRHACVIGPSGSGKTHSLIVPWTVALLASGCSVVTVDVKGDFLAEVKSYLAAFGADSGAQGFLWDYAAPATHRWNFLAEIGTDQGVDAAVVSLIGRQPENDSQPYFYQRDYRWLRGLVRLVLDLDGAAATPHRLLDLLQDPVLLERLLPASPAAAELSDLVALGPADFSRDTSGLLNALATFRDPSVRQATSASDFSLRGVLAEPTLLVAVARLNDGRRAEQLSSLLVSQFTQSVLGRFGGAAARPVVFMVDEAPRLKDRVDLEQVLSVARGANAGVCLAAQDVAQFGDEQRQSALLANCHSYVSMHGVSPASAAYLSKRLGTRAREEMTVTVSGSRRVFEPPGRSRQAAVGPVLGAREIMYPPFGPLTAVVHCPSAATGPFLVDLER
jgi:hypothetical protein